MEQKLEQKDEQVEAALKIYMPAPNAMPMPTVARFRQQWSMPITFIWRVKDDAGPQKADGSDHSGGNTEGRVQCAP